MIADEAAKDPSFVSFRTQLLDAIKKHNKVFVEEVLSNDVLTALGGGKGKQAFNEQWENLSPESSFWNRMQRVLLHGAEYDAESREFHAPAVSFDDSHASLPQAIVWNKGALLYKSQNDKSQHERRIFAEQVTIIDPKEAEPVRKSWVKIRLADGSTWYMKSEDLYSAYDEFAMFKKSNSKWYLTWFGVAGI